MRLERTDLIEAGAENAFLLLRDRLPELARYLPNVSRIEVESREENGDTVKLVSRWFAKAEIPEVAKKFIKPEYLSWRDFATWKKSDLSVDYHLESVVAKSLFEIKGRNVLAPKGDKSELHVTCDVEIYPEKLPGLPRFMAAMAKKPVEAFIKQMLSPNLTSFSSGLNAYYAENKK